MKTSEINMIVCSSLQNLPEPLSFLGVLCGTTRSILRGTRRITATAQFTVAFLLVRKQEAPVGSRETGTNTWLSMLVPAADRVVISVVL